MAFNPNDHELIFPHRQNLDYAQLRVLSTIGPHVSVTHKCPGRTQGLPASYGLLLALRFSVTDRYLAALYRISVHIWRRDCLAGWTLVAQTQSFNNSLAKLTAFAFSPDGYHCALAHGSLGEVSVWGPANKGRAYTRKMYRRPENTVRRLLFTPDASQLVMVGAQLQYLPLMPAPERRHQGAGFRGEFPG